MKRTPSVGVDISRADEAVLVTNEAGKKTSNVSCGVWRKASVYHPICRKLFNESCGTFLSLQSPDRNISKASLQYRSILKACIEELEESEGLSEEDLALEQLLYKIELIWHLVELLLIDKKPGGVVMPQLLSWIRWHFSECEQAAKTCLLSENPSQHPKYWDAVYGYLLQGRLEECRKLLKEHNSSKSEAFQSCSELLRKMPMFNDYFGQSITEFELRWQHWQEECKRRLTAGEFSPYPKLEVAVQVLCGEFRVLIQLSSLLETWYELVVAVLLYTKPMVRFFELEAAAQECIPMFMDGSNVTLSPLDSIIRAAFDCDVVQVISESQSALDNCWFTAHLADILHHAEELEQSTDSNVSLREWLLLEYSSLLMNHPSLWQIGVDYLDNCPTYGLEHLRLYLLSMPIQSKLKANKVMSIAHQRNLTDVVSSVYKSRGRWMLSRERLGGALAWALKSGDAGFASHLAECFLQHYVKRGQFFSPDLLDHLGPMMLISDKLTFLGKFREFCRLHEEDKLKEAAQLLVSLVTSQMAPNYFALPLLLNALPLLERDEQPVIVSEEQTRDLMMALTNPAFNKLPKDKEEMVRLALARNLARALIS